jgi:hypothetical protein
LSVPVYEDVWGAEEVISAVAHPLSAKCPNILAGHILADQRDIVRMNERTVLS